jgi:hypothetical protein
MSSWLCLFPNVPYECEKTQWTKAQDLEKPLISRSDYILRNIICIYTSFVTSLVNSFSVSEDAQSSHERDWIKIRPYSIIHKIAKQLLTFCHD